MNDDKIEIENKKICPNCGGSGKSDDGPCSPPGICSLCNGTGFVK